MSRSRAYVLILLPAILGCLLLGLASEVKAQAAPAAAAASELTARGEWSPSRDYVKDDLVTSRGSTWRARTNSKGKVPGSTSPSSAMFWQLFAAGFNPRAAWGGSATYHVNDLVTHQNATWRAKRTSKNLNPSTHPVYWELFAARGAAGATGPTGAQGPQGPAAGPGSVANGTVGAPALSFASDPSSGLFSPGVGKIAMAAGGALLLHNRGLTNTALGQDALKDVTIGNDNTAVGAFALTSNTDGVSNTAVGSNSLRANTGGQNTAVGVLALFNNTTAGDNAAFGYGALGSNTTGSENTAVGSRSLRFNTIGVGNAAVGVEALSANTTGGQNTAMGVFALTNNTTAGSNAAFGYGALGANTTGSENTAGGSQSLSSNTTGERNTAVGSLSLSSNTTGEHNTAVGVEALNNNTEGMRNAAVGVQALRGNTDGVNNIAVGHRALFNNSIGGGNSALGTDALASNTTGSNNVAVGYQAGAFPTAPASSIFIGNGGLVADTTTIKIGTQGTQTTAFIAGIRGVTTGVADAVNVQIDSNGQLGTVSSSLRYKEDIHSMGDASAVLMQLRPVTFRYRKPFGNGAKPLQYGLIAEEVAAAMPNLAVFDKDGRPETVKYHLLPALLLNEVQRQQKTIQAQERRLASLEAELARLESRLTRSARAPELTREAASP